MLEVLRRGRFSDGKTQEKTVGNSHSYIDHLIAQ